MMGLGWSLPGETHSDTVAPSVPQVKYLTHDWWLTLYTLRFSELLEVNEEGTKVRRWVITYVHTFCMVCLNICWF